MRGERRKELPKSARSGMRYHSHKCGKGQVFEMQ